MVRPFTGRPLTPERELVLARLHRRLELRVVDVERKVAAEPEEAAGVRVGVGHVDAVRAHALGPVPQLFLLGGVELAPLAAVGRQLAARLERLPARLGDELPALEVRVQDLPVGARIGKVGYAVVPHALGELPALVRVGAGRRARRRATARCGDPAPVRLAAARGQERQRRGRERQADTRSHRWSPRRRQHEE
ncbi:hypothetical protein [Phytohabitans suffuscus]|uniref:hypothetical protein n=1 Tax=Phytohabitans suffuscus TaxID=624315 RepID=UPI00156683BF|nr:hypothetical protein [Phytohabitans suffuscus]